MAPIPASRERKEKGLRPLSFSPRRFSLRLLLLLVAANAVFFAWRGHRIKVANEIEKAVEAFQADGGSVFYSWDYDEKGRFRPDYPHGEWAAPEREWTSRLIGLGESYCPQRAKFLVTDRWWLNPAHAGPGPYGSNDALRQLAYMPRLIMVGLAGAKWVNDESIDILLRIPRLEVIDLYGTDISDIGLLKLARLKNLRAIDIRGTRISPLAVAELKRVRPDIRLTTELRQAVSQ